MFDPFVERSKMSKTHVVCRCRQAADLVDLQWLHHVEALAGGLRQAGNGR